MRLNRIITLILLIITGLISCEETETLTRVEGQVFRGPINPVEIVGEINNAPFSAEFHVFDFLGERVLNFNSAEDGTYSINLAPGSYRIVPDNSAPLLGAEYQIKDVIIGNETIIGLDLYFDTGIR